MTQHVNDRRKAIDSSIQMEVMGFYCRLDSTKMLKPTPVNRTGFHQCSE